MELHITNGDAVGEMLIESPSVNGKVLCWRDVLHDGPLLNLPYSQYAGQRADFLYRQVIQADPRSSITRQSIENDFKHRQAVLDSLEQFDQITLWFEHDLYDQLQLLEVLKSLKQCPQLPQLYIICIDSHPEVNYFYGLGNLNTEQLADLYPQRQHLSDALLQQADQIWQALTVATPLEWQRYLEKETEHFPYLRSALERFAQEFPAPVHGLTLTQWRLLNCLHQPLMELPAHLDRLQSWQQEGLLEGESAEQRYQRLLENTGSFSRLFLSVQELEKAPFMGDLWVKVELDRLCSGERPLMESLPLDTPKSGPWPLQYRLTDRGIDLMQGQGHWLDHNSYDLWRGGVHIRDDNLWYWNQQQHKFIFHSNV